MMQQALVEYLVNALWQVPLLAGGAWLLVRVVKPGPQMQHRIWLAVLGLAVLLPIHGMGTTPQPLAVLTPKLPAGRQDSLPPLANAQHTLPPSRYFVPQTRTVRLAAGATHWLVRLYMATIVFSMLRIAWSWRATRRLVENSQETALCDRNRTALDDYGRRLRVKLPQLRESAEVSSPVVVGMVAPVLLLPEGFAQFSEDEVRAALCHELAHVRRRDYLMNVVCQLVALPLTWHPVVSEVQQRIRMTREMVCDAMAAQEMKSQIGYAKCLLALAHSMMTGQAIAGQEQFLGLFSSHTLEERIMRLTETTTLQVRAKAIRLVSGAAVTIAVAAMAAMFHVAPTMAQSGAAAPSQATKDMPSVSQTPPVVATPPVAPTPAASPRPKAKAHPAPQRRAQIDEKTRHEMEDAFEQIEKARAAIDSPEFKKQMEDAQRQAADARAMIDSPEFKKQMEDAQRQAAEAMAKMNSPEFKMQMQDAQRSMAEAATKMNSPEFKRQMEDAQRSMADAAAKMNSPEFKRQMEDAQRSMADAAAKMNSPEFRKQMEDLQNEEIHRQLQELDRENSHSPNQ